MAQWLDNLHGSDRSCGVLGSFRPSSDVQPHFSRDELLELLRNDWRRLCIGYLVKHTQGSFWFYLVEPGQMEYCHGNLFLVGNKESPNMMDTVAVLLVVSVATR